MRFFFLGGDEEKRKITWISWDRICRSKELGGLGVVLLKQKNSALLGKWWGRFGSDVDSLWRKVVCDKYYGSREVRDIGDFSNTNFSGLWKAIVRLRSDDGKVEEVISSGFRWKGGGVESEILA